MSRVSDVFAKAAGSSALGIESLGTAMPIVTALAKAAGVTFEETVATLGKLSDRGIDASTAATGLRNIFSELMSPTSALKTQLKAVGLTAADVSLENQTLSQAFDVLKGAGFGSAEAMQAFGKRSGPIALTLLGITGEVRELTTTLEGAGGTAKSVAEQQLGTLQGQLKLLTSALESVVIPIGQALIPALTSVATAIAPVLQRMAEWAKANPGLTQAIVTVTAVLGGLMLTLGPLLIMLPGLVAIWPAIALAMGAISGPVIAVGAIIVGFVGLVASNWDLVKSLTTGMVDGVIAAFQFLNAGTGAIWDRIVGIVRGAANFIGNILSGLMNAIRNVLGAIGSLPGAALDFLLFGS
jgi:phage-related protein